jgi:hypothetical protein
MNVGGWLRLGMRCERWLRLGMWSLVVAQTGDMVAQAKNMMILTVRGSDRNTMVPKVAHRIV